MSKNRPNKVVRTDECEKAFRILKETWAKGLVLQRPDYDRSFLVQMDASDHGMGAVLSQMDEDGCDHPVAYYSRKFLRDIHISSAFVGEEIFCGDRSQELEMAAKDEGGNSQLTRSLNLQPYQFEVQYRPGKMNEQQCGQTLEVVSPKTQ